MKFTTATVATALFSAFAAAVPTGSIEARQLLTTRNEVEEGNSGACPKAAFIFARGTTEPGNMGLLTGPQTAGGLEDQFGAQGVWIQGVGGPYTATVATNLLPDGASDLAINEMVRLVNLAIQKCPNVKVTVGGYSQGAALAAAAVSKLPSDTRNKVVGAVLFGYTKNLQNDGQIPNYPADKTKIFCAFGDLVCTGSLIITAAHLSYSPDAATEAPQFLASKIGA